MAYGNRFVFTFDSKEGKEVEITIAENGYDGEIISRPVGGHPTLRMDSNGCVKGMSLTIPAECQEDDEYAVLYTTDPFRFKVTLYLNSVVAFEGFISPELYSAPWIDPPYDVTLTATDGLGELKRIVFQKDGVQSLKTHIEGLLGSTGLHLPVSYISRLTSDATTYEYFFIDTMVSLDHLSGNSCYDVLQAILMSIHATVRQSRGGWLVLRETDVDASRSPSGVDDIFGNHFPVVPFGSMQNNSVWPVGYLTSDIEPARNGLKVIAENVPGGELMPDADMSAGTWSGTGSYDSVNDLYEIEVGEYISNSPVLPDIEWETDTHGNIIVSTPPNLSLKVEAGLPDLISDNHKIKIQISASGNTYPNVTATRYLSDGEGYPWSNTPVFIEKELTQKAGRYDSTIFEIIVPIQSLDFLLGQYPLTLVVRIEADDATINVYSCSLKGTLSSKGVETVVNINNGARGAASDVKSSFADSYLYNAGIEWLGNCLFNNHSGLTRIKTLRSQIISAAATGIFIGEDYALSFANPRLWLRGILHFPVTITPPVFLANGGIDYLLEQWTYDLYEDEFDMEALSLPAVAIDVASVHQATYQEASGSGGGSSSGGSGGGGGVSGNFLPLTGGTMTGVEKMVVGPTTRTTGSYLSFVHDNAGDEIRDADVSANTNGLLGLYSRNGIALRPGNGETFDVTKGLVITKSDVTFNGVSILGGGGSGVGNVFFGRCVTAISASTKIVNCPAFTAGDLQDGTVINVLFENRNSVNGIYMNVNSTGAQQVAMGEYPYYRWEAGTIVTFVYRDQQWALVDQIASPNIFGSTRLLATFNSLNTYKDFYTGYGISARMGWWLFRKSLAAPRIKILRGYDSRQTANEYLAASHIMRGVDNGLNGCFVLMMYSKRRRKRVTAKGASPLKAKIKEGWGEARGALATNAPVAWISGNVGLDWLREKIIRLYVKAKNGTNITTVTAFKTANTPIFGDHTDLTSHRAGYKNNRLFGVAWRINNPQYVAPTGEVETTRVDANGNPRYFYSDVAPFRVWINQDYDGYNMMGFQVAPYKDGGR